MSGSVRGRSPPSAASQTITEPRTERRIMRKTAASKPGGRREHYREVEPDQMPPGAVRRITKTIFEAGYATIADERTPGWDRVAASWPEEIR